MQYAIDQKNGKAKKKLEKGQRSLVDMLGKKEKKKVESTNSSSLSDEEEVDE
jgi:hypothetical protein